ncbi:putative reverse transcriptase domain-containing protein [Tanacetum coccineum]
MDVGDSYGSVEFISNLDAGNPLYMQSNDNNGLAIVNVKLIGAENYKMWETAMKIALKGKNKIGFIDGTCVKQESSVVLSQQWERRNAIVLGRTACTCDAKFGSVKHTLLIILMRFLMGLNDVYQQIKSTILAKDPLSNVKDAFYVVSREESNKGLHPGGLEKWTTQISPWRNHQTWKKEKKKKPLQTCRKDVPMTATFGKVKNYEDEDDHPIDFETEFPAIVFDNTLTAIQSEPTVCPPNKNELDFRISLDESDDEDYTVFFDENSFSPLINSECIDEINLIDETSLFEYDKEIVSRFNDLFNDIHPDDLKSEKDDDDNDIGSFVINLNIMIWNYYVNRMIFFLIINLYVPYGIPFDPKRYYKDGSHTSVADAKRHPWLRYQIEEYTEGIRHSYEQRLETIWSRPVNQVHVLDFEGLTVEMRQDLAVRLRMLGGVKRTLTWRQFILALRLHMELEMSDRDFLGPALSYVLIRDPVRRLCHRMIAYSISGRGQAPEKVADIDLFYLRSMDCRTINVPHLLAQLVSDDGLRGLQAWVAQGPERQQAAAAGAPEADEADQAAEEVAPEIPAPAQAPRHEHLPPPAPQPHTRSQRIERLEEEVHDLWRDIVAQDCPSGGVSGPGRAMLAPP